MHALNKGRACCSVTRYDPTRVSADMLRLSLSLQGEPLAPIAPARVRFGGTGKGGAGEMRSWDGTVYNRCMVVENRGMIQTWIERKTIG